MADAMKVGPWGPQGGQPQDINKASKPQSLVSITICSSESEDGRIFGFSFVYKDQNRKPLPVGPWGKIDPEHNISKINMDPDEYLVQVFGTTDGTGITSLKLVTNKQPYGPRTMARWLPSSAARQHLAAALGVYVLGKNGLPVKIGPWGGSGQPVDITTPVKLKQVSVYSTQKIGERIKGFSFVYVDQHVKRTSAGPWGTVKGHENLPFSMSPGEYVNNFSGTFDDYGVTSLKFTTNQQNVHGPYGYPSGTAFSVPLPNDRDDNGAMVGFFGHSGESLMALGIYVGLVSNEP
ncbi:mannose/glucose-specific lectin-like [Lolium perenne]|uniref:mannose/glucose-specific lectin-like n=1 Tax=Lolium perenne TaxID=4522 RepID=UPI003A98FA21